MAASSAHLLSLRDGPAGRAPRDDPDAAGSSGTGLCNRTKIFERPTPAAGHNGPMEPAEHIAALERDGGQDADGATVCGDLGVLRLWQDLMKVRWS